MEIRTLGIFKEFLKKSFLGNWRSNNSFGLVQTEETDKRSLVIFLNDERQVFLLSPKTPCRTIIFVLGLKSS